MSQRDFDYNRGFNAGEGERTTLQSKIDALQALLTAADERVDRLESGIKWEAERNALLLASLTEAEDMLSVTSLEAGRRIEQLEELLRDINDAPGGSQFKKHIDALLKPEEPKEGPHLVLDICGLEISAAEFMKALNITYQLAVPQSMTDTWWFFNCENVREISRLKVMTVTAQQCVGWGLSQHMADEIKARCKLPLKPVNLDVSFKPGTGGNHD